MEPFDPFFPVLNFSLQPFQRFLLSTWKLRLSQLACKPIGKRFSNVRNVFSRRKLNFWLLYEQQQRRNILSYLCIVQYLWNKWIVFCQRKRSRDIAKLLKKFKEVGISVWVQRTTIQQLGIGFWRVQIMASRANDLYSFFLCKVFHYFIHLSTVRFVFFAIIKSKCRDFQFFP